MAAHGLPFRRGPTGLLLSVRVTPKSATDRIDGVIDTGAGPALRVRVKAAPERGKANAAVTATVAGWLAMPRSQLAVVGGGASRSKTLAITGDPGALARLLGEPEIERAIAFEIETAADHAKTHDHAAAEPETVSRAIQSGMLRVSTVHKLLPITRADDLAKLTEGLRLAGLPE